VKKITSTASLLLAVTGCGGTLDPAATTTPAPAITTTTTAIPTPTESPSPMGIKPTSIKDVATQLENIGLTCDEYKVSLKGVAASCDDLILLGYSDGTKKQDNLLQAGIALTWQSIRSQDREDEIAVLVGDNWYARLALQDANTLHDDLGSGGVVLH